MLIEASTDSEWVARCLEALGHEVSVADPNFAPMYATRSRKVKTDRRDARALAEACLLGAYRPAHRLSDPQRHVRGRLGVRDALVHTRTRYISVIRALLRQHGYRVPSGSADSFIDRVRRLPLPGRLRSVVAPLLAIMRHLNQQLVYSDNTRSDANVLTRPAASYKATSQDLHPRDARLAPIHPTSWVVSTKPPNRENRYAHNGKNIPWQRNLDRWRQKKCSGVGGGQASC